VLREVEDHWYGAAPVTLTKPRASALSIKVWGKRGKKGTGREVRAYWWIRTRISFRSKKALQPIHKKMTDSIRTSNTLPASNIPTYPLPWSSITSFLNPSTIALSLALKSRIASVTALTTPALINLGVRCVGGTLMKR
jgi:hypothetical protein